MQCCFSWKLRNRDNPVKDADNDQNDDNRLNHPANICISATSAADHKDDVVDDDDDDTDNDDDNDDDDDDLSFLFVRD